jgi:hypothetical protein
VESVPLIPHLPGVEGDGRAAGQRSRGAADTATTVSAVCLRSHPGATVAFCRSFLVSDADVAQLATDRPDEANGVRMLRWRPPRRLESDRGKSLVD